MKPVQQSKQGHYQSSLSTRCFSLLGINRFQNHKTSLQHKVQEPWLSIKIIKRLNILCSIHSLLVTSTITGHHWFLFIRSAACFKERWKVPCHSVLLVNILAEKRNKAYVKRAWNFMVIENWQRSTVFRMGKKMLSSIYQYMSHAPRNLSGSESPQSFSLTVQSCWVFGNYSYF